MSEALGTIRIALHGRLRKRFGPEFNLGVSTPAAALYALSKLVPGFGEELGLGQYRVRRGKFRGGVDLPLNGLALRIPPGGEMHLIPAAKGSKGGSGKIILGAVLVVAAVALMQPEIAGAVGIGSVGAGGAVTVGLGTSLVGGFTIGNLALAGGAMLLSGILQAISPTPRPNNAQDQSFLIGGLDNTSQQGGPVPVVYGSRMRVGSVTVSVGYSADEWFPYNGVHNPGEDFAAIPGGTDLSGGTVQSGGNTGSLDQSQGTGSGGGGKSGGSSGGNIAPDTLHSNATVRIIDVLGEGPIGGLVNGAASIFFNGTPLQNGDGTWNFRGVTWEVRYGYPDQAPVSGFPAASTSQAVGLQVKNGNPITQTITGTSLTSVRVTMQFPALFGRDASSGDVNPISNLNYLIEIRPRGPGFTGTFTTYQNVNLNRAKSTSTYEKSHRFVLPQGSGADTWDIRVTRLTPDSTDIVNLQNDSYFSRLDLIDDHRLIYPNTAYIAYTFDARLFGSSLPRRQCEIYGRTVAVPRNYDAATRGYSPSGPGTSGGTWDLVSTLARPTDNPAWIMLDMLSNSRYGCGIPDALLQTTKADLYQIAQYCDGIVPDGYGGTEPRYTVNVIIASQDDAYRVLQLMANAFRGTTYWGGGQIVAIADMPRAPTKLVNQTNVLDGSFEYQGTSLKTRHNIINVSYLDENNRFLPAVEPVMDVLDIAKRGAFPTDLIAWGCLTRSLAHRLGKWALYTENHQTETVSYKAGAYHIDARPGDVIKLHDPAYVGVRMAGRLRNGNYGVNLLPDSAAPTFSAGAGNAIAIATGAVGGFYGTTVYVLTSGGGADPTAAYLGVSVPAGTYTVSAFVIVPAAYTGSAVQLFAWAADLVDGSPLPPVLVNDDGSVFVNADGTALGLATPPSDVANLAVRDQFQRLVVVKTFTAPTTLFAVLSSTAAAGQAIYTTGWMVDPTGLHDFTPTAGGLPAIREVTIDADIALTDGATSHHLSVVMPDGTIDDLIPIDGFITTTPGAPLLQLGRALAMLPSPNAEWIVTDSAVAPREFAIVGVSEDGRAQLSVTAVNYEPGKFDFIDFNIAFDQQNYSQLPGLLVLALPAPTNISARDYMTGVGVTQTIRVTVSWTAPTDPRVASFQVMASSDSYFKVFPVAWAVSFDIDGLPAGEAMTFGVRSVGEHGNTSAWTLTTSATTVDGKVDPPGAPTGLTAVGGTRSVQLSWSAVTGRRDIIQYEIWRGSTSAAPGSGATLLSLAGGLSFLDSDHATLRPATTWYYWVRAIAQGTPLVAGAFAGPAAGTTTLLLTDDLGDAIINTAKFAQSIAPVQILLNLDGISDLDGKTVPLGGNVVSEVDRKLYRRVTTGTGTKGAHLDYVAVVQAVDMDGQLTSAQIASIAAAKVSGTLTAAQILSLTAAQITGQIVATQITDGAISTPKLAAGSVTTAALAAGSVTTASLAVGSASNVIWNACMEQSADGWNVGISAPLTVANWGTVKGTGLDPTWRVIGYGSGYIQSSGNFATDGSKTMEVAWDPNYADTGSPLGVAFPASTPIEAQAMLLLHRCCARVQIDFYNAAGTYLSSLVGNRVAMAVPSDGKSLDKYVQSWAHGVSPATCARARLQIVAFNDGGSDIPAQTAVPYLFFTRVAIGASVANAVSAQVWVPGGVTTISGSLIKTDSIQSAQIAAGAITTSELAAGAVTAAKITAGSITSLQIAANTITAGQIAANTITAATISAGAIGATEIAAGSIHSNLLATDFQLTNSAQIGTAVIESANIAHLTVGTINIADGAATNVFVVGSFTGGCSMTVVTDGSPILFWWAAELTTSWGGASAFCSVLLDGTSISDTVQFDGFQSPSGTGLINTSPGSHTLALTSNIANISFSSLTALTVKK